MKFGKRVHLRSGIIDYFNSVFPKLGLDMNPFLILPGEHSENYSIYHARMCRFGEFDSLSHPPEDRSRKNAALFPFLSLVTLTFDL